MAARGRRVLVVEDDEAIRGLLSDVLAGEGYEIEVAAGGHAALALLREWRRDLIILDLLIPDMDGRTFHLARRKLPGAADVPVLVLSAAGDLRGG